MAMAAVVIDHGVPHVRLTLGAGQLFHRAGRRYDASAVGDYDCSAYPMVGIIATQVSVGMITI